MLNKVTSFLAVGVFLALVQPALPGIKLHINSKTDLTISSDQHEAKSFPVGSIAQSVTMDGQAFKVSYGKDLQGALTIIIYPEASQKQPLQLSYANSNITVSPGGVLTLITNGSSSVVQTGVLGVVAVNGKKIPAQSSVALNNPGVVLSNPDSVFTPQAAAGATVVASPNPVDQSQPNIQSTKIKFIWGDVFIAKKGAAEVPLKKGVEVGVGDTIRTGANGQVQVSFFPNTFTSLERNSKLTIRELYYSNANDKPQRKLLARLESGAVFSKINTKDAGNTDYQIQTPGRSFKATGTKFSVQQAAEGAITSVIEGEVTADDGSKIPFDYKGFFAPGQAPIISPLSDSDLLALEHILNPIDGLQQQIQDVIDSQQSVFTPRLVPDSITPVTP
jgi:hypothetical protein